MKLFNHRSLPLFMILSLFIFACEKGNNSPGDNKGNFKETKTYSADIAIQWMDMQVKQMRAYPGIIGNVAYSRHYAYSGITLYEAVVPGMPSFQSIASQLNGLTGLPKAQSDQAYHWSASANAALAFINKKMFPGATPENKTAMDELEANLLARYRTEADASVIDRSIAFGKAVAEAVFNWSEKDGYTKVNDPYTQPADSVGGKFWTQPANPLPVHSLPFFGKVRRLMTSSGNGAGLEAPDYNNLSAMTIDVINSKPVQGSNEYNMAFWWRDFPGTSTPGHYVSILKQVLQKKKPGLDEASMAYALGGITVMDITITTWQDKFKYLLARPFNYDDVIGQPFTSWLTAPHPEYPAAHASLSIANAEAMTSIFGDNFSFTDSTFFGLVTPQGVTLQPREYKSFRDAGEEAGWSRLYGGIHYRKSIEDGFKQGKKVASNVLTMLKFKK